MNQTKNADTRQWVARARVKVRKGWEIVVPENALGPAFGVDGLVEIDPEHAGK
jgi:hypothetical protein